jgi:hypothetical protein
MPLSHCLNNFGLCQKVIAICQITIQHLFELFLVVFQTISFSSTHDEFAQRLATLDDTID